MPMGRAGDARLDATDALASDAWFFPASFVADTRQKQVMPLLSPVTVMGEVELLTIETSEGSLRHTAV